MTHITEKPKSIKPKNEPALPRPVEPLRDYANAKARRNAADKLSDKFGLSPTAAAAIANAAVDPSELRKVAENPELVAVPGGNLLGIRTRGWARKVAPDPRTPRLGPAVRHPFAVAPGTAEDSRFRPLPDPVGLDGTPELSVDIESREHLNWAISQAKKYILHNNDWRQSIRTQGVMQEVWAVAITYVHADDTPDVCAVTSVEGSSRMTAVHDILDVRSVDLVYDGDDRAMRARIRRLNEAHETGAASSDELGAMRSETVPVLFLVGFRPHLSSDTTFDTAVKSLVALRHVDPPKPWGAGPEMASLAEAILDELERRALVTPMRRRWLGGSITRAEAKDEGLSDDATVRAAAIIQLLSTNDPDIGKAIRVAVTGQSTRRRVTRQLRSKLAAALIVRAVDLDDGKKLDRIRRYLEGAFGKAIHEGQWKDTNRPVPDLLDRALREIQEGQDEGAASLELAARAAYPLVVTLSLWADRGWATEEQLDRRDPGAVIDQMRRSQHGLHQLGQALRDFAAGKGIRVVNPTGHIVPGPDGTSERRVTDTFLRQAFPPPGMVLRKTSPKTAQEHLTNALADFSSAVRSLVEAFGTVHQVEGVDGDPLVDREGVREEDCKAWLDELATVSESLILWRATHRRRPSAREETVSHESEAGWDDRAE